MNEPSITILSAEQAWEFLAGRSLGRLAVSAVGQPDIFPVNYVISDHRIVFRTAEGTKLMAIILDGHVAFEADDIGETEGTSVVARGRARRVEDDVEIESLDLERLHPQIATFKYNVIAIDVERINGRHFFFGEEPVHVPVM